MRTTSTTKTRSSWGDADAETLLKEARALAGLPKGDKAAAGVQANKLAETDPEAAEAIVDELVKRYKSATTDGAKLTYLDALGNSGHPKAYPFLEEATRSSNPRYEKIGTYGMRFLPGADADNVLELQLASSTKSTQLAAVHAIGFRSADTWRSVLEAARSNAPGEVQGAIDRVLRMWS